jgi:phosphate transport system substrate-binding protein
LITPSAKRVGALAITATMFVAACSSSGSTPSPTAAATSAAPTAAPSVATSAAASGAASPSAAASASGAAATGAIPSIAGPTACVDGSITASGSTALQPLVDAAGKAYTAGCPKSTISVQGGGSGTGLTQVSQGAVQIGNSDVTAESKLASPDAAALVDHIVAKQGWVVVVNPGVTGVTNLTSQQLQDIWACPSGQTTPKTTNWKDVGGPDMPIVLILRPASSGTRATFKKIVLNGTPECAGQALTEDSNGAVTTAVSQTPGSISVIGFAYYAANQGKVTAVGLDGVQGSVATMQDGTYKLSADGHMYTKGQPDGLAKSFLDYMLSDPIQKTLIPSLFYAPVQ